MCYNGVGDIMKKYTIRENEYELIKDYRDGFDLSEVSSKLTDYFDGYDYILGDWAYSKLRLKGFCEPGNSLFNDINDYSMIDNYIKENCAYNCKYFILRRM